MKKLKFIKVILLIVIILMISYTLYIFFCENDDFINWLNTLISTLISVLLALLIALYIFYYQMNLVEKGTRNKFFPLIESNLIGLLKSLSDLGGSMKIRFKNREEVIICLVIFPNIIFEQAIISNVFDETETEHLLSMKNSIDYHNKIINQVTNMEHLFIESPDRYEKHIRLLAFYNEDSIKKIKGNIKLLNRYFKFDKLNSKMLNAEKR